MINNYYLGAQAAPVQQVPIKPY